MACHLGRYNKYGAFLQKRNLNFSLFSSEEGNRTTDSGFLFFFS